MREPEMEVAAVLNVAATCVGTRALGPGLRSVVWVQGCPFHCRGCLAPEWIPDRPARRVAVADLATELLADPAVTGLTFSGGEPMAQAAGLAELAAVARADRELTVVCFTGFRLERLRRHPPDAGVCDLLEAVDVLIDGQYVEALNDGTGLRGSSNQRVHHLTARLRDDAFDWEGGRRAAEIRVADREVMVVGVPPHGLLDAVDDVVEAAHSTGVRP